MHRFARRLIMLLLPLLAATPVRAGEPITIFAAASLTDALRAVVAAWQGAGRGEVRLSFAASSTLARQIEQGAPADLLISADEQWMDWAQERRLVLPASRVSPLGNALVLVAPATSAIAPVTIAQGFDPATLLGASGRIATGDPAHVPVGRYAEAALRWLGRWEALSPRLARADNVRAALLFVERGEAPLGIVYATDAAASRGVTVIGTFPPESHTPVTYPFALTTRGDNDTARAFLAFATGTHSAATWRRFGFTVRE